MKYADRWTNTIYQKAFTLNVACVTPENSKHVQNMNSTKPGNCIQALYFKM